MAIIHFSSIRYLAAPVTAAALCATLVSAQQQNGAPFQPEVGQAGKDVVWVPTPEDTVKRMLDMAKVTPQDYVIDLGSGDGRNVIAAAKRGATALGVEYNPDMVTLSKQRAAEAGVTDKATFVEGDMYAADISKASVMALFLLPENLNKLRPKFLALKPGSRIVSNTFTIENWEPVEQDTVPNCTSWCTVLLYIVPANVAGTWQTAQGTLTLTQDAQDVSGTLGTAPLMDVHLRGDELTFSAASVRYTARVAGDTMQGTSGTGANQVAWRASRGSRGGEVTR